MTLDPVSTLLLDEAFPSVELVETTAGADPPRTAAEVRAPARSLGPPSILVIDDPALASHLHLAGQDVRAYCDDLRDERLLPFAGLETLDAATLAGVGLVLLRLPKSLGMLEDYAQRVAAFARADVRLLAGGRQKHLTRSMNEVLAGSFTAVRASLGRQKSRVLHATGPKPTALSWPRTVHLPDHSLTVVSHAGVFAADKLDAGTRLLLDALAEWPPRTRTRVSGPRAVDLGCGTGILASWLAQRGYDVLAVDTSRAACASARDTAAANCAALQVVRTDGLGGEPASSVDLVVCNPPFHRGTTKDSTPGFDLLRGALPALRPGAEVWTVFNSHLPYLPFLRREIGPTQVVARDCHYTVTRSQVAGGSGHAQGG